MGLLLWLPSYVPGGQAAYFVVQAVVLAACLLWALRVIMRVPGSKPWLLAGVLFDTGDVTGIAGAWNGLPADKRAPGIAFAGAAALAGLVLLARQGG